MNHEIDQNADILEALKKDRMTTKEEVIQSLERRIKRYSEGSKLDNKRPAAYYSILLEVLGFFLDTIKEAVLFETLPDWWIYLYEIEYDQFVLRLCHVADAKLEKGVHEGLSFMTDASYPLIGYRLKSFTVDEFATTYGVGQGTVRQWIRRGKIRTAIKRGNEWRIPVLTLPPERGYTSAQYIWHEELEGLPEEYSFLNEYKLATFFQDAVDKNTFHVILVSKKTTDCEDTSNNKELILDAKEREKLELVMIANPGIRYSQVM